MTTIAIEESTLVRDVYLQWSPKPITNLTSDTPTRSFQLGEFFFHLRVFDTN